MSDRVVQDESIEVVEMKKAVTFIFGCVGRLEARGLIKIPGMRIDLTDSGLEKFESILASGFRPSESQWRACLSKFVRCVDDEMIIRRLIEGEASGRIEDSGGARGETQEGEK